MAFSSFSFLALASAASFSFLAFSSFSFLALASFSAFSFLALASAASFSACSFLAFSTAARTSASFLALASASSFSACSFLAFSTAARTSASFLACASASLSSPTDLRPSPFLAAILAWSSPMTAPPNMSTPEDGRAGWPRSSFFISTFCRPPSPDAAALPLPLPFFLFLRFGLARPCVADPKVMAGIQKCLSSFAVWCPR